MTALVPFNGLSPAEAERLAMLAEEAGEIVQAVGKCLRHGFEDYSPHDTSKTTNRSNLRKEINDLLAVVGMLEQASDVTFRSAGDLVDARDRKLKYSHHQQSPEVLKHMQDNPVPAMELPRLPPLTPSQTSGYMQAPMEPSPIRSPHSAGVFTKPLTPSQKAD